MEIPRDRDGRPLIIPIGGGKPIGYTRVSTLAKLVDDDTNLTAWKQRMTAVGIASNPHLLARVAGVVNNYDDPIADGKRDLNSIVAEAVESAGGSRASSTGTALHEMTQALDLGRVLKLIPAAWEKHLDAYLAATADIEVLDIETFVVVDEIQAAGTLDRLVRLPDGRVCVADLKTGAHDANYPMGVTTQVATYAHGKRYDPETGERTPLHPDIDLTTGVLIHLPAKGSGECRLYGLALDLGWDITQIAMQVHAARKHRAAQFIKPLAPTGAEA